MPTEIFRCTVYDDIDAIVGRGLVDRGSESVVDHGHDTFVTSQLSDKFKVGDIQVGIGRGLDIDQFGVWAYGFFKSCVVRLVYVGDFDAILLQKFAGKHKYSRIVRVLDDDMVSGLYRG